VAANNLAMMMSDDKGGDMDINDAACSGIARSRLRPSPPDRPMPGPLPPPRNATADKPRNPAYGDYRTWRPSFAS
jgi:hypothetical protein